MWNRNQPTWLLNIALTALLGVVLAAAATWRVHRLDPGRRKTRKINGETALDS